MSFEIFMTKYIAQLKAMNPKYDTVYTVSTEHPIRFEDPQNVKLTFACMADTHLPNRESAEKNLANFFEDVRNSETPFDAVLMAGDIADYGFKSEYKRFFRVLDSQKNGPAMLVTVGNHDARIIYRRNTNIVMKKVEDYLGIDTKGKSYYSCDIKGYTFLVLATEKRVFEKAHITSEQIAFLDRELKRGTKDGKPAFVMCHQPFAETHGLPEVWKTGDMGKQNDEVRAKMEKYKNVFFINGHLHGGVFDKTLEVLNEKNNVISLSIPGYRKPNNFGITDAGVGYYAEVYEDRIVFTARNFLTGEPVTGEYTRFAFPLI